MKSREISRSKIEPFSLACTVPYIGIGWEYQSIYQAEIWYCCKYGTLYTNLGVTVVFLGLHSFPRHVCVKT